MRSVRIAFALVLAGVVLGASAAHADDVAPFQVTLPTVSGPVPSDPNSFAFGAEGFGSQPAVPDGYVVEEFFFSGTGNIYEYTPTGIRVVDPCPPALTQGCTNVPYTTRMLVKRPKNRRAFSGTW
jgi:hypothetical protein